MVVILLPIQMDWLSVVAAEESVIVFSGVTFISPNLSAIAQPPIKEIL